MRRRSWTGLGTVLLCLLVAAPAGAAFKRAPIDVGAGDGASPSAVVDASGTAHIAWGIAEELIGYCALPRGARACALTTQLALDAREGRPIILQRPQDGLLVIVASRDDSDSDPAESTWAFTSAGGAAWSPPVPIGLGMSELDAAVLTADGQAVDLLRSDSSDGNLFQRAPLGGPPAATVINLSSTPAGTTSDFTWPGDMVRTPSGRTLAFLGGSGAGFAFRALGAGDPFSDASWQPWPARRVSQESDDPRSAAGKRGAYVMYGRHLLDQVYGSPPQVVRRLKGARWGRPRGLFYEVDQANTDETALAQDAKGRLHAAIVGNADSGRRSCIAYARAKKGRWFSRAVSVHQTLRETEEPGRVRLAVGAKGPGLVAWATRGDPTVARVQWLKAGKGITRPRNYLRRSCPPFAR